MKKSIIMLLALLFWNAALAQKRTLIKGGNVHVGDGRVLRGAAVLINGKWIEAVITDGKLPQGHLDTIIDASGKEIYPGLINTNNVLGLHDAEAVRATRDYSDVGKYNPHNRALIAYNTDNKIVPTIKTNGVLYTQVTPRGGVISGASSVMALEGWNWEDAVLLADDGIHVNFPLRPNTTAGAEETKKARQVYENEVYELEKLFSEAKAYLSGISGTNPNVRFESMRACIVGNARVYFHVNTAYDIMRAVTFAKTLQLKFPVIVGGAEAFKVTSFLKENKVPVMLRRVNELPDRNDDEVDQSYKLPYLLYRDSVAFCFQMEGDMEAMNSRNLAFNAGTAVGYGLPMEEAVKSLTYWPAKITGCDNWIGTIETGKLASLFICSGNVLEIMNSDVLAAWIAGNPVTLNNQQSELYQKYLIKFGLQKQ
jgi:imidazolonepropionase-like amidohydrolase